MRYVTGVVGALLLMGSMAAADSKFVLNGDNTRIEWVGTKPGGKHDGGFKKVTGVATIGNAGPQTLKIVLEIDNSSLYSDTPKLTAHLKSPDFFGVANNPTSKFVTTRVERKGDSYTVTGDLTLLNKTKSISFPAKIDTKGEALTLVSTFKINRADFGMNYGRGKIHDEVTLKVNLNARK